MNYLIQQYDEAKINALRLMLENNASAGQPITYKVVIDNEEIIPKTDNHTLFSTIDEVITPDTVYIDFIRYQPNMRNRRVTRFMIQPQADKEQLGNIPSPETVKMNRDYATLQLSNHQLSFDNKRLNEENSSLKHKVDSLLDKYHDLAQEHAELKSLYDSDSSSKALITTLGNFTNNALDIFRGKPAQALSGMNETSKVQSESEPPKQSHDSPSLDETALKNFRFIESLMGGLPQHERAQVISILEQLGKQPEKIESVMCLLYQ
jgi:hypothetical protein